MEAAAAATTVVKSSIRMHRASSSSSTGVGRFVCLASNGPDFLRFSSATHQSPIKNYYSSVSYRTQGRRRRMAFRAAVRASLQSSDSAGTPSPLAPLQMESPVGQFLSQILMNHPHLVPAAVDQQLQQLQTDRDADKHKEEPSVSGTDLVLYRRIAEVKANERRKTLEEIMYALVVQKFMDADVSLVPTVASSSADVELWPRQDDKVERLHSPEANEMIQHHLALILGNRVGDSDSATVAELSKLRVGQVYAASVMYGYFLKRVDRRFQLEKTMKTLPDNVADAIGNNQETTRRDMKSSSGEAAFQEVPSSHSEVAWSGDTSAGGFGHDMKASRLRSYVMSFNGETLQRFATIRSKEAVCIIEKHTEALFGKPDIVVTSQGTVDSSKGDLIDVSCGDMKRLVLEAVTFGSFLWDVESYVDSRYHFVAN